MLEHVEGVPLDRFLDEIKSKPELVPRGYDEVGKHLLNVLSSLHGLGVLHRDTHPRKFLMTLKGLRVFDLGYAIVLREARPTQQPARPPRHGYEAPDYVAGALGDESCDYYGVGMLVLQLLAPYPEMEARRSLYAALCARQLSRLGALAQKLDDAAVATNGSVGLRTIAPEPLEGPCNEPLDYLEVAACLDMLRSTFGFPDHAIRGARIAPGFDHVPGFGFEVIDSVNGTTFRIDLVANCSDVGTFWRNVSAWLDEFSKRYSPGLRIPRDVDTRIAVMWTLAAGVRSEAT